MLAPFQSLEAQTNKASSPLFHTGVMRNLARLHVRARDRTLIQE